MDSESWKAQVSHIQGHSVYIYTWFVFNSVDIVNLKIVDSVGIKLMATGAQCNWLSLRKARHFLVFSVAAVTERFWIQLLEPEIRVTGSLPS